MKTHNASVTCSTKLMKKDIMKQSNCPKDAQAFLIRCWQEPFEDAPMTWRFAIEEIGGNHEQKGFSSFEDLSTYLLYKLSTPNGVTTKGG